MCTENICSIFDALILFQFNITDKELQISQNMTATLMDEVRKFKVARRFGLWNSLKFYTPVNFSAHTDTTTNCHSEVVLT